MNHMFISFKKSAELLLSRFFPALNQATVIPLISSLVSNLFRLSTKPKKAAEAEQVHRKVFVGFCLAFFLVFCVL